MDELTPIFKIKELNEKILSMIKVPFKHQVPVNAFGFERDEVVVIEFWLTPMLLIQLVH